MCRTGISNGIVSAPYVRRKGSVFVSSMRPMVYDRESEGGVPSMIQKLRLPILGLLLLAFVARAAQRAPVPIPEGVKFEANILVAMRDGVRLAADVYRPDR